VIFKNPGFSNPDKTFITIKHYQSRGTVTTPKQYAVKQRFHYFMRITRLRASPRHGGSRWFFFIFFNFRICFFANPQNVILPIVDRNFLIKRKIIRGVKGMLPLGCFPLRGREGVTLISLLKS
jgi:hypothetical protein